MGPGPELVGYIIDECTLIHASCLEDALSHLPVTVSAAIYDDDYSWAHNTCEICEEVLDPDVEDCEDENCYHCGHRPDIESALEILEQAQTDLIADHAELRISKVIGKPPGFVWDTPEHEAADKILDNAQEHLRNLL